MRAVVSRPVPTVREVDTQGAPVVGRIGGRGRMGTWQQANKVANVAAARAHGALDVDLSAPVDLTGLDAALSAALPDGVEVTGISAVASNATALQAVVDTVTWELEFEGVTPDDLAAVAARVLAADDVPLTFERKGKELTENVRPALLALTVAPDPVDGAALLTAELATRPRSVRPGELAICLGEPGNVRRVRRIEQWMTIDGVALPPLAAGDPSSPVDDRLAS